GPRPRPRGRPARTRNAPRAQRHFDPPAVIPFIAGSRRRPPHAVPRGYRPAAQQEDLHELLGAEPAQGGPVPALRIQGASRKVPRARGEDGIGPRQGAGPGPSPRLNGVGGPCRGSLATARRFSRRKSMFRIPSRQLWSFGGPDRSPYSIGSSTKRRPRRAASTFSSSLNDMPSWERWTRSSTARRNTQNPLWLSAIVPPGSCFRNRW